MTLQALASMVPALVFMLEGAAALLRGRQQRCPPGQAGDRVHAAVFMLGWVMWMSLVVPWFRTIRVVKYLAVTLAVLAALANLGLARWIIACKGYNRGSFMTRVYAWLGAGLAALSLWAYLPGPAPAASLPLPLDSGPWYVVQGGPTGLTNHHAGATGQRHGVDLVLLGRDGRSFSGDQRDNRSYHAFGRQVLAPVAGEVVEAVDGLPDRLPGQIEHHDPLGNHVILETRGGIRLVFAHLRQGTVSVTKGQCLEAGQLLGEVGNSGRSSEPHLHLHAMVWSDGGWTGVPFYLNGQLPRRSRVFYGNWASSAPTR